MLKIHARKLGDVTILCLKGRIVVGENKTLRNAVLSQSDVSLLVLDLSGVTRIDASGLGVLLELREQTHSKGIEFRLMNVTKLVEQVLEITCLNSVFEISSEGEVLSRVSRALAAAIVEAAAPFA
ncbi:MAG: STAS domain-containing protein [Pyrinomonadaceae bacterium]